MIPTDMNGLTTVNRHDVSSFDTAADREWLVTNGLGGYAAGTIADAATRRYHGLLVASLRPPVQRTVLVVKVDTTIAYGNDRFELGSNEYQDGTVHPSGYRHLGSFRLDAGIPTWTWFLADAVLVRRVWMQQGRNTTFVAYTLERASVPMEIGITPLCSGRDYHWHAHEHPGPNAQPVTGGCEISGFHGIPAYRITSTRGEFHAAPDWHRNVMHRAEKQRGLDDTEDLFRPGTFSLRLEPGETVVLACSTEAADAASGESVLAAERSRITELAAAMGDDDMPDWIRQLAIAADQFIVQRKDSHGRDGTSVIAGYPWFSDWGRDTMIALPGLTLATGRAEIAGSILRTFAEHVSEGMLPNRFPDAGEEAEYNTVDATLWYFDAIDNYIAHTGDRKLARDLYPLLKEIVDCHLRGTRYDIHVDDSDALLHAGVDGVQLTWMDAKVGDWVVTPRIGKAVEINALWHRALQVIGSIAKHEDDGIAARRYRSLAADVADSFNRRFWNPHRQCLYDVIDGRGDERDAEGRAVDSSVRPNQIFAVSLPGDLLTRDKAKAVVDVCARELWTPYGLRSLARNHEDYVGTYGGGPLQRDGAYHQGTVWSWLLGPFVRAHLDVYGDPDAAASYLAPLAAHLQDACIGSVSEVFSGDEPHRAGGCFAQAWSVAEVLRAWRDVRSAATLRGKSKEVRSA